MPVRAGEETGLGRKRQERGYIQWGKRKIWWFVGEEGDRYSLCTGKRKGRDREKKKIDRVYNMQWKEKKRERDGGL